MENINEKQILVFYISVRNIEPKDIGDYIYKVKERITIPDFNGHAIFIPVTTHETKVECINPKYITNSELIKQHTSLMEVLNNELQFHIKKLNKNE